MNKERKFLCRGRNFSGVFLPGKIIAGTAASHYNNKNESLLQWEGITKKRKDYSQPKILNSVVFTEVVKPKSVGNLA